MYKVLIVEADRSVRERVCRTVAGERDFEVCGAAETEVPAIQAAGRCSPGLIIVGLALPQAGLGEFVGELKKAAPKAQIFLLTEKSSVAQERRALALGIAAVFLKGDDLAALMLNARAILETDSDG